MVQLPSAISKDDSIRFRIVLTCVVMAVFAPFPLCALRVMYDLACYIREWERVRGWTEITAQVLDCDLKEGDSEGHSCSVFARYNYSFDGQGYEGSQIGLWNRLDQRDAWPHRQYERLQAAKRSGSAIPCYVNPAAPAHTVLERAFRICAFLSLACFGLGFAAASAVIYGGIAWFIRDHAKEARLKQTWPNSPWMWEPQWASGLLRSNSRGRTLAAWLIAAFILGLSGTFAFSGLEEGSVPLLIMPFLAGGIVALLVAIHFTRVHLRFRSLSFALKTQPGRIGGSLEGDLRLPGGTGRSHTVKATLACRSSEREGEDTVTNTLWEETQEQEVTAIPASGELRTPLCFQIPADCIPTSKSAGSRVSWELRVHLTSTAGHTTLKFCVPVFC